MDRIAWGQEFSSLSQRFAGRIAVTDDEGTMSYQELFSRAAGLANLLRERDLPPGTPVATYIANSRQAVWVSYGAIAAGIAEASINPMLVADDVAHCIETCGTRLLLTSRARIDGLASLRQTIPGLEIVAIDDIESGCTTGLAGFSGESEAHGKIIFTSGTTGRPKGVVYTHRGRWLANIVLRASLPVAPAPGMDVLLLTPFSHGASLITYAYLDGGAQVTLLDGLDVDKVEAILKNGQVGQLFAPPTVLAKLMTRLDGTRIESIHTIFCGTASLSPQLYERVRACFGPVVRITYGKSETFNPITILTPSETDAWYADDAAARTTCVGWPASGIEIAIADEENEADGADTRVGPVMLRARHQFAGLMVDGGFTPHPADAFHRTGDVGFLDKHGRLHLVGRESDLIKTGGYRLSPEEVEASLGRKLLTCEFVVVGLPSAYWGEVVTAVLIAPGAGELDHLAEAAAQMTPYKRPRLFAVLDEMPRNAMGKIVRSRVRDAVLARYELSDGSHPELRQRA